MYYLFMVMEWVTFILTFVVALHFIMWIVKTFREGESFSYKWMRICALIFEIALGIGVGMLFYQVAMLSK